MTPTHERKTVVIGASPKTDRFSNKAVRLLRSYHIPVRAIGYRLGTIADVDIEIGRPHIEQVDTLALYISPPRQQILYDYILDMHPKRIIFNPGTENPALMEKAAQKGIEVIVDCVLVMLQSGLF